MNRWRWFVSADLEGRWITTEGFVDITVEDDVYQGYLMTSADADPLDHMVVSSEDGNELLAKMTPPGESAKSNVLTGCAYMGKTKNGEEVRSMVFTDRSTVLGLALGPRSSD